MPLYNGPLEVKAGGRTVTGEGELTLGLKGDPRIGFVLAARNRLPANLTNALEMEVSLPLLGSKGAAHLPTISAPVGLPRSVSGILGGAGMEVSKLKADGQPESVGRVVFHLLNFPCFAGTEIHKLPTAGATNAGYVGRVTFGFGKWTVALDQLRGAEKRLSSATAEHGYAFTHVGTVRKTDGKLFTPEEAGKVLDALSAFFSFARGARCACVLPTGYRYLDDPFWRLWQAPVTAPTRRCETWFADQAPYGCFEAAERFATCWANADRRKWLMLGINLYCAGNEPGRGVELQIAESQIPLELLTCVAFLEENSLMSEKAFEDLSAADKVRVLLFWLETSTAIPAKYAELSKASVGKADAPQALTEIRNAIIHPTKSNRAKRDKISDMAIYEAWQLNMWYVELALLKLIGHSGPYCNRTTATMRGMVDTLPWTPT